MGISVEKVWCHAAFARERKLHFPLLADFEPKGAVATTYGVYPAQDGVCDRALLVNDSQGIITWSYVSPMRINPRADGILPRLVLPVSKRGHIRGPAAAPVTIVEYGDYECPYCGAASTVLAELREEIGNLLRLVLRNFPLTEVHPHAEHAAEIAEAAAMHHKFWEMHDTLFAHQNALGDQDLAEYAIALGLSANDLRNALAKHAYLPRINEDFF